MPECDLFMVQVLTDKIILEVIDKGLNVLGESPKQAIWYYLENSLKIKRDNVPEHVEEFEKALQNFFGIGYGFLKNILIENLQEVTGEDLHFFATFADCIQSLRQKKYNKILAPAELP